MQIALPSPRAVAAWMLASASVSVGSSWPRQAASSSEVYLQRVFPVASMIASASAISTDAAANSPA